MENLNTWKTPHIIKIYEALGAIADNRITCDWNSAKVTSSSGNKVYNVTVDISSRSAMSNDNAYFYTQTLGYPVIAFLLKLRYFSYDSHFWNLFANIHWKDINQKNNNDFDVTKQEIDTVLQERGIDFEKFQEYITWIMNSLRLDPFSFLWEKTIPPKGY